MSTHKIYFVQKTNKNDRLNFHFIQSYSLSSNADIQYNHK